MYIDYGSVIEGFGDGHNEGGRGCLAVGKYMELGNGHLTGQCQSNNSDRWESFRVKGCFFGGHQSGD